MNERKAPSFREERTVLDDVAAWIERPVCDDVQESSKRLPPVSRWICASLLGAGLALVPNCGPSPDPGPCADGCMQPAYGAPGIKPAQQEIRPQTLPRLEYFQIELVPHGAPWQVAGLLEGFTRSLKHCLREADDQSPLEKTRLELEMTMEAGVLMDASILSPLLVQPEVQRCVREAAVRVRRARYKVTREETRNYWRTWTMRLSLSRSGPPERVWPMTSERVDTE